MIAIALHPLLGTLVKAKAAMHGTSMVIRCTHCDWEGEYDTPADAREAFAEHAAEDCEAL